MSLSHPCSKLFGIFAQLGPHIGPPKYLRFRNIKSDKTRPQLDPIQCYSGGDGAAVQHGISLLRTRPFRRLPYRLRRIPLASECARARRLCSRFPSHYQIIDFVRILIWAKRCQQFSLRECAQYPTYFQR